MIHKDSLQLDSKDSWGNERNSHIDERNRSNENAEKNGKL